MLPQSKRIIIDSPVVSSRIMLYSSIVPILGVLSHLLKPRIIALVKTLRICSVLIYSLVDAYVVNSVDLHTVAGENYTSESVVLTRKESTR